MIKVLAGKEFLLSTERRFMPRAYSLKYYLISHPGLHLAQSRLELDFVILILPELSLLLIFSPLYVVIIEQQCHPFQLLQSTLEIS